MAHIHKQHVPRAALIGAAVLMVGTITLAAGARQVHLAAPVVAEAPPQRVRTLRFSDRPDGTLAAIDVDTGNVAGVIAPGTNNFVRGVLRGLYRGRKLESLPPDDAHFRLAREADGRLTLGDPATGRHIELDSFGPVNASCFGVLLTP